MSLAISSAANLKPSVRLAQAVSEFGAALDDKHRRVFKTWQTHSPPTESDAIKLTEEVNRDGSRLHGGSWRPLGTRLVRILDQVQVLIRAGDILVSGSQNLIASGVWATVATGYLSYFEKVSLLLMRLGQSSAIQRDRAMLFPNSTQLVGYMCEYLIVMVKLCKRIVLFEKKSIFSQLASGITLDKEFKEYETQLGIWSKLINEKITFLNNKSQVEANAAIAGLNNQLSLWVESRKDEAEDRRMQVLRQLSPYEEEFERAWRRQRKKGSVKWILSDSRYESWRDNENSSTLEVHGSLGSGKTVAMANIAGELWSDQQGQRDATCAIAVFLCQFGNQKTLQPHILLGSLAHQFLKSLGLSGNHPAIRMFRTDFDTIDAESILQYMITYLPRENHYYVILDALDEFHIREVPEALQALKSLQENFSLHLCCSVRRESLHRTILPRFFISLQDISMSSRQKDEEIEAYIKAEMDCRSHARHLDESTRQLVQKALVDGAQGMYLWVVLQIDALFPLYQDKVVTAGDVARFLRLLPTELSNSFERALGRIQDRRYGSRIFELVAAVMRPLTKDELRSALNIEPGEPIWDNATLPHDALAMIYSCAGGLLEIDEEDETVHYIHHSALRHLLVDTVHSRADLRRLHARNNHIQGAGIGPWIIPYNFRGEDIRSHQHEPNGFLFDTHQANTTLGYTCVTALNLEHQDRRVSRGKRLVANNIAMDAISDAVAQDNMLSRVVAMALQRNSRSPGASRFDMTRMIEDLSRATSSTNSDESQRFSSYARDHWLHHTPWPSVNTEVEKSFNKLFLQLLHDNPPGLVFPWNESQTKSTNAILWAKDNGHFRLLFNLLSDSTGEECEDIIQYFKFIDAPDRLYTAMACNSQNLRDVLCRYADFDLSNADGIRVLLLLGASPNASREGTSIIGLGTRPLQLAFEKMMRLQSFDLHVVRSLLDAGADTRESLSPVSPLVIAIRGNWLEGYHLLTSYGGQLPIPQGALSKLAWTPLGIAILCDENTEDIIAELAPKPEDVEFLFKSFRWPILGESGDMFLDGLFARHSYAKDFVWVNSDGTQEMSPRYANIKILRWLVNVGSNVNITAKNGMTPLGLATELSNLGLVEQLLEAGANPNGQYQNLRDTLLDQLHHPLMTAFKRGSSDIWRCLSNRGALYPSSHTDDTRLPYFD